MEVLDISEGIEYDESINSIEYHTHQPYTQTSFKNSDEIRIAVQNQANFVLPCQSFLYLEGRMTKEDGGLPTPNTRLTNNAFSFLFEEIRYEVNGVEIDRVRNVGITTTLKGFASFTHNTLKALENAGWLAAKGESKILKNGHYNVCIPLSCLLGVMEDYKKIWVNAKHELVLIRARRDENSFTADANDKLKVQVDKIFWKMPYVIASDKQKLKLLKIMERGKDLQVGFRSWNLYEYPLLPQSNKQSWVVKTASQLEKPRYIIVAFQTGRKNNNQQDASRFDHCNLRNLKVHLNDKSYPYDDMNLNFGQGKFALLYDMFTSFQPSYYGKMLAEPCITRSEFEEIAPICVIDCSKQDDSVTSGAVDIRLEFESENAFTDQTSAYCLVINDREIEYNPLTCAVRKVT